MKTTNTICRRATFLSLLAASLLGAGPARAIELPFGVLTALPGTTVGLEPQLAGVVLDDPFHAFEFETAQGRVRGQIQSRVSRSTLNDTLTFSWRIFNDAGSAAPIPVFRVRKFEAPEAPDGLRADWRIDSLGDTAPTHAHALNPHLFFFVFGDGSPNNPGLLPGMSSKLFFLDTEAKHYALTADMDVFRADPGGYIGSGFMPTFAPAVPEPGTWTLMALGMATLCWRKRRSRQPNPSL
jgi:hypothetical protein